MITITLTISQRREYARMKNEKPNLLFLCTGNSCRSQMAEGWSRSLHERHFNVYSAGVETHGLNPFAVKAMEERGIDISQQHSTLLDDLAGVRFDYVVTVCDHAASRCPNLGENTRVLHHSFGDPPKLAKQYKDEEKMIPYRQVCAEIEQFVARLPEMLNIPHRA